MKSNPKPEKSPEKDLSSTGKAAWDRSADSNRGNCPKPEGWDQNSTSKEGCMK